MEHAKIVRRYVLSLEVNRGPVGASIGVLGRGFTPQDVISLDGTAVRTVFASPTSLSFFVPAMPTGKNYQVTLGGTAGNSPVGTFRIDGANLTVSPSSLTLGPGRNAERSPSPSRIAAPGRRPAARCHDRRAGERDYARGRRPRG